MRSRRASHDSARPLHCGVMRHELNVFAGSRDGYSWLVAPDGQLALTHMLVKRSHLGMRLAITCFDSGSITATEQELSLGWSMQGEVMVSPPLTETLEVPGDHYDEWYISETQRFEHSVVEPFVNYGGFTLAASEVLAQNTGRAEANYEFWRPLQERFWRQLLRIAPETFIGWGDNTVVVSRRYDFVRAVHAS